MKTKFDHETLMMIAGHNTPEAIAERILRSKRYLDYVEEKDRRKEIKAEIMADEERLITLVLDGKTNLDPSYLNKAAEEALNAKAFARNPPSFTPLGYQTMLKAPARFGIMTAFAGLTNKKG